MRTLIKTTALTLTLAITQSFAAGIPTIDGAAIQQNMANNLKELAEMGKQLTEAKNQVEQLKANVNALTGNKGFSDILKMGGIDPAITGTFDDLLKGNTAGLTEKAKAYLDNLPSSCADAKNKSMCEQVNLGGIVQIDFIEKLNKQIENKLQTISALSERAKQAKDMKSMAELQAQISLEANSIATLQLQADNFEKLQDAQRKIVAQQAAERDAERRLKALKSTNNNQNLKQQNFSNLLN